MDNELNMFFDCLVIQADGEYGYHIYYKDIYKEFSFYTSVERIDFVLQDIVDRCEKHNKGE